MSIETDADRLILLNAFGEDVTVDPNGSASPVRAVFDAGYLRIDGIGITPTSSVSPELTVRDSDITEVTTGTTIAVKGVNYTVDDIQPDGNGMTVLKIKKD